MDAHVSPAYGHCMVAVQGREVYCSFRVLIAGGGLVLELMDTAAPEREPVRRPIPADLAALFAELLSEMSPEPAAPVVELRTERAARRIARPA